MVRWPLQPLQPLQKTQLQPTFGPSVDLLCHPWFTTTNLSYRFPIFETSATALCGTTSNIIYIYTIYINATKYTPGKAASLIKSLSVQSKAPKLLKFLVPSDLHTPCGCQVMWWVDWMDCSWISEGCFLLDFLGCDTMRQLYRSSVRSVCCSLSAWSEPKELLIVQRMP